MLMPSGSIGTISVLATVKPVSIPIAPNIIRSTFPSKLVSSVADPLIDKVFGHVGTDALDQYQFAQ